MAKQEEAEDQGGSPAWMATFADLMSLLLTFFVLLLSFAEMDIIKFRDAMGSISSSLGITKGSIGHFEGSSTPISFSQNQSCPPPTAERGAQDENDDLISEELEAIVQEYALDEEVEVKKTKRGVVLRVRGRMFFNPGTSELKTGAQPLLVKIASILRKFPREMAIEGHTDNIPISNSRFSSNWELSTARAYSSLMHLQNYEKIDIKRMHIAGFGDTRPLTSNDTPEGRGRNRRVEFVFLKN